MGNPRGLECWVGIKIDLKRANKSRVDPKGSVRGYPDGYPYWCFLFFGREERLGSTPKGRSVELDIDNDIQIDFVFDERDI